jgi:hypothetical protein
MNDPLSAPTTPAPLRIQDGGHENHRVVAANTSRPALECISLRHETFLICRRERAPLLSVINITSVFGVAQRNRGLLIGCCVKRHVAIRRNRGLNGALSTAGFQKPEDIMSTLERETSSLIGSDKVEGTTVYGMNDNSAGTIQRVMIDKISGKVAYAVVSFGGFLGMGEDYYPLPWSQLKYDTGLGGYRTNLTEDKLKGAPKYGRSQNWDWSDRANDRRVYDYYQVPLWYAD